MKSGTRIKALAIAALAVACALALAACGGQTNGAQSDNKIVVGYASDNYGEGEGQSFEDNKSYNTYIKATLENLGWEAELKGIAYADIEKSINDGVIDCFWDNYTIQGREDMYAWSDAYIQARPVLVWKFENGTFDTKEALADIASLASLPSGKTIGVKAGSVTYANLPDDQKAIVDSMGTLKEYPGLAQCKEAFDKGEVDMILAEVSISTSLFNDLGTYGRIKLAAAGTNEYGVAFKKGNEDKAQAITEALRTIYKNGTIKENFVARWQMLGLDDVAIDSDWEAFDSDWLLK